MPIAQRLITVEFQGADEPDRSRTWQTRPRTTPPIRWRVLYSHQGRVAQGQQSRGDSSQMPLSGGQKAGSRQNFPWDRTGGNHMAKTPRPRGSPLACPSRPGYKLQTRHLWGFLTDSCFSQSHITPGAGFAHLPPLPQGKGPYLFVLAPSAESTAGKFCFLL